MKCSNSSIDFEVFGSQLKLEITTNSTVISLLLLQQVKKSRKDIKFLFKHIE
jgi:hypothetical protein